MEATLPPSQRQRNETITRIIHSESAKLATSACADKMTNRFQREREREREDARHCFQSLSQGNGRRDGDAGTVKG